jgi:hypothetical protein
MSLLRVRRAARFIGEWLNAAVTYLTADAWGNLSITGVRNTMRDDFNNSGSGLSAVNATLWDVKLDASMTMSASGSALNIVGGTVANVSTVLLSKQIFTVPFRGILGFRQSQAKQANEAIRIEFVAINEDGTLDENNKVYMETPLAGTGSVQYSLVTVSDGNSYSQTVTGQSINTIDGFYDLSVDWDQIISAYGTLNSSRTASMQRDHILPDVNKAYKLRVSVVHDVGFAGTATTFTLYCAVAMDMTEVQAEITGSRGGGPALNVAQLPGAVYQTVAGCLNVSTSMTRPANVTQYAVGQLVANNTVAGSVVPIALASVLRAANTPATIQRLRLRKSGPILAAATFRVHLFGTAAPTVANGDGAALSMSSSANYLGYADINLDQAFTDGANGNTSPSFVPIMVKASAQTVWALLEARDVYTPLSGEVFTLTAEVLQD